MGIGNHDLAYQHPLFFDRGDAGGDCRSDCSYLSSKDHQALSTGLIPRLNKFYVRRLHRGVSRVYRRRYFLSFNDADCFDVVDLNTPANGGEKLDMYVRDNKVIEDCPRRGLKPCSERRLNIGDIPANHYQILASRDDRGKKEFNISHLHHHVDSFDALGNRARLNKADTMMIVGQIDRAHGICSLGLANLTPGDCRAWSGL